MTGRLPAALALAACALAGHSQQIYKWVDEKGVTHYTTAPPAGGKAQAIKPAPASPNPAAKTWQEQEMEFRARQVERAEAQHKDQRLQQEAARRREVCGAAQRDLRNLKEQVPVYTYDEKGERQYMSDPQRADAMRRTQTFIDRECKQAP